MIIMNTFLKAISFFLTFYNCLFAKNMQLHIRSVATGPTVHDTCSWWTVRQCRGPQWLTMSPGTKTPAWPRYITLHHTFPLSISVFISSANVNTLWHMNAVYCTSNSVKTAGHMFPIRRTCIRWRWSIIFMSVPVFVSIRKSNGKYSCLCERENQQFCVTIWSLVLNIILPVYNRDD